MLVESDSQSLVASSQANHSANQPDEGFEWKTQYLQVGQSSNTSSLGSPIPARFQSSTSTQSTVDDSQSPASPASPFEFGSNFTTPRGPEEVKDAPVLNHVIEGTEPEQSHRRHLDAKKLKLFLNSVNNG